MSEAASIRGGSFYPKYEFKTTGNISVGDGFTEPTPSVRLSSIEENTNITGPAKTNDFTKVLKDVFSRHSAVV